MTQAFTFDGSVALALFLVPGSVGVASFPLPTTTFLYTVCGLLGVLVRVHRALVTTHILPDVASAFSCRKADAFSAGR